MWPESWPAPYFEYHPSRRNSESSREVMATKDPDLEEPWNWDQKLPASSGGGQELRRRRKGTFSQRGSIGG